MGNNAFNEEMTPRERITALREGRPYDRVPCNPSLSCHAARVTGIKVSEYHQSAEKMAAAQLAAYKTYGHDSVGVSAILGIVHGLGGQVIYPEQSSPYITGQLIKDFADVEQLVPLDIHKDEYLSLCFEAAKILIDKIGREVPIHIGLRAPYSTAATLRGVETFSRDLYYNPEFVHKLLQTTLDSMIPVVQAAIKLGAEVSISDPVASGSLISPKHYREYAAPYAKALITAIREAGGVAPTLHICGNTKKIWRDMADTGAGVLSIEDKIDLAEVRAEVGDRVIIAGNIRPTEAMYLGTPDDVVADVKQGLRQAYDNPKGYIVQLGCGLPIDTPAHNMHALCFHNVQVEGIARSKGAVTSKENQQVRDNYRKYHNHAYERYCHLPQQVFIEIQPTLITLWKYVNAKPCRDFLYIAEQKAVREYYYL